MKKALVLGAAYFSCTVGAGFASGQEMLQYYAAFGWWGVPGAIIAMLLMPLAAMIAMQYGSYFQATSHGTVFNHITNRYLAKFVDYSITFTQFCICFVMLAGAGANLEQQWGIAPWIGSAAMAVAVIVFGMLDVDKISNVLSILTPLIIILFLVAAVYTFMHPPADLGPAAEFAASHIDSGLPNWWVSTLNYVGIAMMGGVSMGIVMGGDTLNIRDAGRGGAVGGFLFGTLLLIMVVAMLFKVEEVHADALPTLSLVTDVNPTLGIFASVVIYLMIFSTCLGNYYSLSRRLTAHHPPRFTVVLVALVAVGFLLSFVDFATLVGSVFPIMGYVALVMIAVLIVAWLKNGRSTLAAEARRRGAIRWLIGKRQQGTLDSHGRQKLEESLADSNLSSRHLARALNEPADE